MLLRMFNPILYENDCKRHNIFLRFCKYGRKLKNCWRNKKMKQIRKILFILEEGFSHKEKAAS
jgi:hypothetical protein